MSKKKSQLSNDELYETTEEHVSGEPVDSTVNPDGITIDPSIDDSEKVNVETPVVENPTPDTTVETPVTDENLVSPDSEIPVDKESVDTTTSKNVDKDTTKTPVDKDSIDNKISSDKESIIIVNEFKRFNIRLGYSIDSRSTTTRRTLSTTEIVKQFVKAPTCFIAFESKEDVKEFETILKIKNIKVENNEGKLIEFSDAAKKHLIERVTELSKYWISRNSK